MSDNAVLLHRKSRAFACLSNGRLSEAHALYTSLCSDYPEDAESWFLLGALNGQMGSFEEAIVCCRRAITLQPGNPEAYFNLGIAMQRLGRFREAGDNFRAAIRLKPDYTAAIVCFKEATLRASSSEALTITMRGGIRICVPHSLQLLTPYVLLEQEDWFEDEIGFVRRLIQPGAQVVDIGANYGVYTLTMAKLVGAGGRVWAFEPASATAAYLEKSMQANAMNNIHLTRAALSNRHGSGRLGLNENSELNALGQESDSGREETVSLLTLDECASEYGWRDTEFIKLDAEGEEGNIIEGGKRFLSAQSPLIMFELKHIDAINLPLIRQFHSLGYESYRLIRGLNLLAPYNPQEPLDPSQLNLFCCKPDRAGRLQALGLLVMPLEKLSLPAIDGGDAWKDRMLRLPYVRDAAWPWATGNVVRFMEPGGENYRHALNLHALAHLDALPAVERYGALTQSLTELSVAAQALPTGARLQSLARVAWETGHRMMAIQVLNRLVNFFPETGHVTEEPFLAVSDRFDAIGPGSNMLEWCRSAVREQLARLQGYSSYFSGIGSLRLLEVSKSSEFQSAEMERRYQLVRMRHGMQDGPECHRLLKPATDENLNPGYWCN